jgi:hypothetical protein
MTAKAKVTAAALGSLVIGFLLIYFVQVSIKNLHSIEHDFYARSVDRNFLTVPLAKRLEVSALGRFQSV